ncbi:hypothetical protein SLS60_005363 [Paraconiothyrium brasiliense]|uniref:Ubiquitin carboxyl-terminal hydrolase n=1 Tax=Paraconiothyrium brasiliense TaxID=300254 RepID=A0ABR3RH51_9PLEO
MTSFFGRLKAGTGPASPASSAPPAKKDPNAPQLTPLEKLLQDAGPVRADGSDKFFGFENFGSTCYCNSIVQCLYYSVPFREQVINFPSRSPPEALERPATGPLPRLNTNLSPDANAQNSTLSPKGRNSFSTPATASPRKPAITPGGTLNPGQPPKPEDNKDSPEYKKKQALAAGPVLNMDYENSKAYGMSESLFSALKDIFEAVIAHRSHIGVVSPHKFLEILRRENEMFRTPMHQDAHEFLNLLLNEVVENVEHFSKTRVHEIEDTDTNAVIPQSNAAADVTAPSNIGWVHELFEGTLTSETRCLTCENTSQRDEAFLDLSVDLEQHSSVTSCLRKFSEEEMLCERNKFHCDKCGGLQEAEKRMKIKRLPKILALHLKRFKYTEDLQRLQKLFHRVVYPYYLRLFNTTDDAEDPDRLYELYAIVVHIGGGPYHGHYVSIIKTQDRGWLLFDDEMVEPVDKAYVRRFFGGEDQLACAYVLFYQETTEEAMMKEQEEESLAAAKQAAEVHVEPVSVTTPKANGHGLANGYGHGHGHNLATTPTVEKDDQFASLDHAATAPPLPTTDHNNTLDHITTSVPILGKRQSNVASKKEKAKEEKERKAMEKELEKQAKAKRKELETQRRDMYRKQEDDLRAALAASRETATEESKKRGTDSGTDTHEKEKSANGLGSISKGGGLSRFRHSSMSLRHKPKFWSGGKEEKKDEPEMPSTPVVPEAEQTLHGTPGEKEKKNRFSLGRKKSTFHL